MTLVATKKTSAAKYAEFTGLALVLPAATFAGYAIGYYLDKAFGTTWMKIVFLILGTVAGFVSLIRQIMRNSNDDGA
jgi:F0F1-type ATP synthase assembly protein I